MNEVHSIRFNQELEEELKHRYVSWSLSESVSSMDIQQDLITALITREKVQESNTNLLLNKHKTSR